MPDHLKGLLLLVRTSKEEEDQDPKKQRYRSPYESPTASGSLNASALSDDHVAFQSGLSEIGTGAHCPRPRALRPLPLLRLTFWMLRRASSPIPEPFRGEAEDRVAPRLSRRGGCQSGHSSKYPSPYPGTPRTKTSPPAVRIARATAFAGMLTTTYPS